MIFPPPSEIAFTDRFLSREVTLWSLPHHYLALTSVGCSEVSPDFRLVLSVDGRKLLDVHTMAFRHRNLPVCGTVGPSDSPTELAVSLVAERDDVALPDDFVLVFFGTPLRTNPLQSPPIHSYGPYR